MKVIFNQKVHDYPKRAGDLALAWYAGGNVCITRRKVKRELQKQNQSIIQINAISRMVWDDLAISFKKDLALYAKLYKKEYPGLRKRGISSYAVFLMITHTLIRRFSLNTDNLQPCADILKNLLFYLSVKRAVDLRILKRVSNYYQLNHFMQHQCLAFTKALSSDKYLKNDQSPVLSALFSYG